MPPLASSLHRFAMVGWRVALAVLGLAGGRLIAANLDFLDRLLDHDVDLVVDTDMTDAGRKLPDVTPAHPVYYEFIIIGYKDYGREPGDVRAPDRSEMLKSLQKMLADRGYLHADQKHPPALAIAVSWGTMNARRSLAIPFMGGAKLRLQRDLDPVVQMMTPYSLRRAFWTPLQEYLVDVSGDSLYVISVWAFDEATLHQGQANLLWQTKLTCPSTGLEIGFTLNRMTRAALPYLGHETPLPVRVTAPRLQYQVEFGDLQTIEFLDPKSAPKPGPPLKLEKSPTPDSKP